MWVACASSCTPRPVAAPTAPGPIIDLDTRATGLSGLTRDASGALWAVSDHGTAIVRIEPDTFHTRIYAISGTPDGTDLEALAWVAETRFLVGTETQQAGRATDVLLEGFLEGRRFQLHRREDFVYARWGLVASVNHGIEGLCHVDGHVILATELVDERDGRRQAPVAMLDLETGTWTTRRIALTTDTGKLSAVGCRVIDGEIVALAVERHFGVARLLRFRLTHEPSEALIEPEVAADLSKSIRPLPNFEGVVWNDDGSVVLLTDNYYRGRVTGPSRLYFVPASTLQ